MDSVFAFFCFRCIVDSSRQGDSSAHLGACPTCSLPEEEKQRKQLYQLDLEEDSLHTNHIDLDNINPDDNYLERLQRLNMHGNHRDAEVVPMDQLISNHLSKVGNHTEASTEASHVESLPDEPVALDVDNSQHYVDDEQFPDPPDDLLCSCHDATHGIEV